MDWNDEILVEAEAEEVTVSITEDEAETEDTEQVEQPEVEEQPEEVPQEAPEAEEEPTEAAPQFMGEAEVVAFLKERKVKPVIANRLASGLYENQQELEEAVAAEVAYLKEVTGSGRPFGVGVSESANEPRSISVAERDEKLSAINKKYLGG